MIYGLGVPRKHSLSSLKSVCFGPLLTYNAGKHLQECLPLCPRDRLRLLLDPVRCSVAKLFVLEELVGTDELSRRYIISAARS